MMFIYNACFNFVDELLGERSQGSVKPAEAPGEVWQSAGGGVRQLHHQHRQVPVGGAQADSASGGEHRVREGGATNLYIFIIYKLW